MHDVAILHHIFLTFNTHLTCLADSSLRAILDIVVVLDDLSTDKALLEIGMDDTGTLRSLPAFFISPGLHLHLTSGDERLKVQQGLGLLDQTVYTTLFQTQFLEEHLLVFVALKLCDILFCLGSDNHRLCTFFFGECFNFLGEVIT